MKRTNYKNGQIIGNCIFLEDTKIISKQSKNGKIYYLRYAKFKCKCGNEFESLITSIKLKKTNSCGCLKIKELQNRKHQIKHGNSFTDKKSPEYNTWLGMKARCKENWIDRKLYFDKGITVCPRWNNKRDGFQNFLKDMGKRPSKNHSIDRIDGNKGYYPENCRWATSYEQSGNKSSNIMINFQGKTKCLSHWAKDYNISYSTLKYRLKKWNIEEAFTCDISPVGRNVTIQKETRR